MPSSRRNAHTLSLFSLLFASYVAAQDECRITHQGNKYDLTSIAGDHFVTRTRETPPSFMVDDVHFNLCGDLHQLDGVEPNDQCPSGISACLTTTNRKGDQPDRVVAVVPLAQFSEAEYETLSDPKGLAITRQGASYPTSPDPVTQSFRISLFCATETSPPSFKSYDGTRVEVEWTTTAGCLFKEGPGDDSDGGEKGEKGDSDESVGSGLGWFFLV
ncbi:autophagy-related protein 27 [Amylostereum chailletii]|nr:autophagy-related protein 27 [Amylostereum chailletii]